LDKFREFAYGEACARGVFVIILPAHANDAANVCGFGSADYGLLDYTGFSLLVAVLQIGLLHTTRIE
jgi:hypothetical protein